MWGKHEKATGNVRKIKGKHEQSGKIETIKIKTENCGGKVWGNTRIQWKETEICGRKTQGDRKLWEKWGETRDGNERRWKCGKEHKETGNCGKSVWKHEKAKKHSNEQKMDLWGKNNEAPRMLGKRWIKYLCGKKNEVVWMKRRWICGKK